MTEGFILPRRLDSSGAPGLAQALIARRGAALVLDASEVEVIGALALEVLIAAGRQWAADAQPISIIAPSERFQSACATLGLMPLTPWASRSAAEWGCAA